MTATIKDVMKESKTAVELLFCFHIINLKLVNSNACRHKYLISFFMLFKKSVWDNLKWMENVYEYKTRQFLSRFLIHSLAFSLSNMVRNFNFLRKSCLDINILHIVKKPSTLALALFSIAIQHKRERKELKVWIPNEFEQKNYN
ncbi:CLUMA_CG000568, isoform A [Clunio marinus]|uniref:CLUMA_CG000568, isoform A n=1 Tax=Clunio marinus TaxID=568069 RepID=A0A1J1HFI9_9DIPT|nr:CLUMA_CG000568, isoform A [Clunio marinus]